MQKIPWRSAAPSCERPNSKLPCHLVCGMACCGNSPPRNRTYRERKDKYAKSLETEITRTRAKEATLVREVERLQGIVHRLLAFLSQAGWDTIQINELRDEFEDSQSTNASTANPALTEPSGSVVGRAKHWHRTSPTQTYLEPVGALKAGLSPPKPGIRMCDLDPVETGIDFVLTWVHCHPMQLSAARPVI